MSMRFAGCVVYGSAEVLEFYRLLGLELAPEKHGSGPLHHAAPIYWGTVFEVYGPTKAGVAPDNVKLIFETTDLDVEVARLAAKGVAFVNWVQGGHVAQTTDPLGRPVLLIQKT